MDRDKLIERLKKLLAMSRDSSSPAEAAIAARRMKALMGKHNVTLAEITDTDSDYTQRKSPETPPRSSRRRKRTRPSRPTVRRSTTVRPVMLGACGIAAVVSSWYVFTGGDQTGSGTIGYMAPRVVESSHRQALSLKTKVKRSSIMEGESIVLYIAGSALSSVPNTSSLLNDFRIINTQIDRSDNKQSFHMRVELQPRRTGSLFIPSFYVDGIRSEAIVIDVVARK